MNIEMQLKAAEARRNELERQHAEALAALRGCGTDTLEAHQSRVRELEKKVALETVRCEELQLELSTPSVRRNGEGVGQMTSSSYGVSSVQAVSGVSWTNKGTEIERIMAKIEQDNRILAELDHNRATTMGQGLATSASSHALGECSPPLSPITMSHTTPSIYPGNMGTHNSFQPSGLQSTYLPSNVSQNPTSNYNTSPYNTYQHSSYSKPSTIMGSSLTHHNTSLGNSLGQASGNVLGTNLTSNLQNSMGSNFVGTSLTSGGLNMVPSSYTTSTLGNTNTFSNPLGNTINTGLTNSTFNNPSFTNPITNTLTQFSSLPYNPATTSAFSNNVTFSNPLTQYNSLPLSGAMSMKLKQLEESDLGIRRVPTPVTPHNNPTWGLTGNLTGMTDTRPRGILNDGLDSDWSSGLHERDRGFLNGHNVASEGQVDMLDIPGKGRCSVYIARFSYEPEPEIEEELAIQAGDYLLVWGDPVGPGGFLDAELLDGRRGLVPSHFVQRLIGDDLLEFHQAVLTTLKEDEINQENFAADVQRLNEIAEMSENQEDDGPEGEQGKNSTRLQPYGLREAALSIREVSRRTSRSLRTILQRERAWRQEGRVHRARGSGHPTGTTHKQNSLLRLMALRDRFSSIQAIVKQWFQEQDVPAPRQLTLERQLNKSVLISWTMPENVGPGNHIESYHVYVDGVLKATIKATERTRALVEGVDSNKPHRISVRSVTINRRTSRDAACTMIIGKDTHQLGPSSVRATNITSTSAVISWLPANSNHQHVVCVNNVEVRTVKPGVYRHTITGLTANTQYRVTVRAKHHRAAQNVANLAEELPMPAAAHTDFRTLPKGLPDPPSEIMVEPGPQDGTLLVTWHPIQTPHHPGSNVTGYAVYADGKKVTDVDSPTGDHALIDISKLLGLNPKNVTVRTKARDSQSTDSVPTAIPMSVLRGGAVKNRQQPHSAVMPPHIRQQMPRQQQQQQGQQVIEPEENLSDKEIFPNQMGHRQQGGIPSIEITKESYESNMSEDELLDRRNQRQFQQGRNQQQSQQQQRSQQQQQRMDQQGQQQGQNQQPYYQQQAQQNPRQMQMRGQQMQQSSSRGQQVNQTNNPNNPPNPQKRARWFFALFDYDPATMSPNPDACDEELPFSEGDTIKVWGDKDADGFYWGECRGRRGYVPHNMVMEVEGQQNRDRWGDIYANMPVKRMVALYDYDPHELSPNVDAEVELSFTTGQIINVYGDMDDDGFYMGEIDGVRGLVPSNFLTEATDQYGGGQTSQSGQGSMGRGQRNQRGIGPGARGPPPPPRDAQMRPTRSKDACPTVLSSSQLDNVNTASTPNTTQIFNEHNQGRGRGVMNQGGNQQTPVTQQQQQQSTASSIFSSIMGVATNNPPQNQQQTQQQNQQAMQQNQQQSYSQNQQFGQQNQPRLTQMKGVPQVVPNVMGPGSAGTMGNMANQQNQPGAPNLMQKLNEITAPGGDILSKGKELIFMKFGLGGK